MHPDDLQPQHLARLRDNMAETPAKANSMLKAIGALYSWGRETGWTRQANPATGISMLELGEDPLVVTRGAGRLPCGPAAPSGAGLHGWLLLRAASGRRRRHTVHKWDGSSSKASSKLDGGPQHIEARTDRPG